MARNVTLIPAKTQMEILKETHSVQKLRMAAYCRVSTDQEDQLHSFAAQVEYYTDYINKHEEYEMADIYADEGISGTSTRKRDEFRRLIEDCKAGKVDIVITKSISRFARNTQDSLDYMRQLKDLGIPIIFEKENINTMDSGGELLFTILSSLAQDESRNISENCKWGIRNKFRKGEYSIATNTFIGYDRDHNGKLVINGDEAKVVRRIYKDFLGGKNPSEIAWALENEGVKGSNGRRRWYAETVKGILKNEKHKGDALLQKTYTADYLSKKIVRNQGEIEMIYIENDHEPIIDKDTWDAVQEEFERRKLFLKKHGMLRYAQGREPYPFTCKVFCGDCGKQYTVHSWHNRGISQWQCRGHRVNGVLKCSNPHVDFLDLEKGFVVAFNKLMANENRKAEWEIATQARSPLKRIRAQQMLELATQPPLTEMVKELAQLVVHEVTIWGAKNYEFLFMDGSSIRVTI